MVFYLTWRARPDSAALFLSAFLEASFCESLRFIEPAISTHYVRGSLIQIQSSWHEKSPPYGELHSWRARPDSNRRSPP
jgi:hypothetical protein